MMWSSSQRSGGGLKRSTVVCGGPSMVSTPFDRTVAMVYRKPVPELDAYQCPDYRQHILWVDYRLPLEPLRDELVRLCNAAPEWDHRAQVLQVTDTSERAMQ